jgi:hypothetical protein
MASEWKSTKKKTSAGKRQTTEKGLLEKIEDFRKRGRVDDSVTIEQEIEAIRKKISTMGTGRHIIREKRVLTQKIKDLQKKTSVDFQKIDRVLKVRGETTNTAPLRKKPRYSSDDNRRRPSSHSRAIKVSRDREGKGGTDILLEDIMAEDVQDVNYVPPVYVSVSGNCTECGGQMHKLPTEASMACSNCGISRPYLDSTTRSATHGDDRSYPSFSYKKINHFKDWMRSVQAKESTTISNEVLSKVCKKCAEQRLKPEDLTPTKVRSALKACKLRKYYENSVLIYSLLTNKSPPRFKPETEQKLEKMFMQIAQPFENAVREVAPNRKNFLSYSFVCFKFIELLPDVDRRWLQSFQLLKGRDKLFKQDQLWRNICGQLGWKFYPSV